MESSLLFAFVLLLILLVAILYQIRYTIPPTRTIVYTDERPKELTWDAAFVSITPTFFTKPSSISAPPVHDASGNKLPF